MADGTWPAERYIVDLKIRVIVAADNPGAAATEVHAAFTRHLAEAEPGYLKAATLEAHAFEVVLPGRQRTG